MTRRELLGTLVTIAALPAALAAAEPRRYGRLTMDGWLRHKGLTGEVLHVYLDGVDVTKRCFEAHDRLNYVRLWCRDEVNHDWRCADGYQHRIQQLKFDEPGQPKACTLFVEGRVEIRPGGRL